VATPTARNKQKNNFHLLNQLPFYNRLMAFVFFLRQSAYICKSNGAENSFERHQYLPRPLASQVEPFSPHTKFFTFFTKRVQRVTSPFNKL
jgi:hypothetical protein